LPGVITEIGEHCKKNEQSNVAVYGDLVHRCIFIADEFYREDDYNCFHHLNTVPRDKVMESLMFFYNQTGQAEVNGELRSLCGIFLEMDGKIHIDHQAAAEGQPGQQFVDPEAEPTILEELD